MIAPEIDSLATKKIALVKANLEKSSEAQALAERTREFANASTKPATAITDSGDAQQVVEQAKSLLSMLEQQSVARKELAQRVTSASSVRNKQWLIAGLILFIILWWAF